MTLNRIPEQLIGDGKGLATQSELDEHSVSVKKFGAKGDGVTDDTTAINSAISSVSTNGGTIFFPKANYYVAGQINLSNNVNLIGQNTTLTIPSNNSSVNVFFATGMLSNVTIDGLTINSINDKPRVGAVNGALCSNITAVHLNDGVTNFTLRNFSVNNAAFVFKVDGTLSSKNIRLENITSTGVYMPFFMVKCSGIMGHNWNLDCPVTGTSLDHHIYFDGEMTNIKISKLILSNGTGQAIQIENNHVPALGDSYDIHFDDVSLINLGRSGVVLANGSHYDIKFTNLYINTIPSAYSIIEILGGSSSTTIDNIIVDGFVAENIGTICLFTPNSSTISNVIIRNGAIRGRVSSGNVILPAGCQNLLIENVIVEDAAVQGTGSIIYSSGSSVVDLTLQNCSFIFPTVAPPNDPISLRSSGYYAKIIGCHFINKIGTYAFLTTNRTGGTCYFINNNISGFTQIRYPNFDFGTIDINTNNLDLKIARVKRSSIPDYTIWNVGDIIESPSPVSGSALGWVCVTAGMALSTNMAWTTNKAYAVNNYVSSNSNVYKCTTAGTSASSGSGPSGTGASISDNSVVWQYVNTLAVLYPFGQISDNTNFLVQTTKLTSLPTADATQRGRIVRIEGSSINTAEVVSLSVSSGCTTNGSAAITLDGISYSVLLNTADNTATLVATKIRNATYSGWTAGGTGTTVTFTCNTTGLRIDAAYSTGTSGANGAITTTTQGSSSMADKIYICQKMADDTYSWVQIG